MSGPQSFQIRVIHGVALEGLRLAEVAVEVEVSQVVLEQVTHGHGKVIVTEFF
jgi:hypothetical protein